MSNPKVAVLYHANCSDGFMSAAVAHYSLRDRCEVSLHPVTHGQLLPDVHGRVVYILDFFPSVSDFARLLGQASDVVILDHHATAKEVYDNNDIYRVANASYRAQIFIDTSGNKSGALMAWNYFFTGTRISPSLVPVNRVVSLVSDHDTFQHKIAGSEDFAAWLATRPHDVSLWADMLDWSDQQVNEHIKIGATLRNYRKQLAWQASEQAYETTLCGYRVMAVNVGFPIVQDVLTLLRERVGLPAVGYCMLSNGKWKISCRTSEGSIPTAREIMQQLGGGGHDHASGATVFSLPGSLLDNSSK